MVEKALYQIKEAAHYLGVSRSRIYELLESGDLKRTKVLPIRIPIESLRAYKESIVEK